MRKLFATATALGLVLALAPLEGATAKARHVRRHHATAYYSAGRHPIVVERRSFLDPGTVVPAGSTTLYATMPAYANGDPPGTYQAGTYMMDTLHPPFAPQPRSPILLPPEFDF
jgi:hypothetical protein